MRWWGAGLQAEPNRELWDVFDQLALDAHIQLQLPLCRCIITFMPSIHILQKKKKERKEKKRKEKKKKKESKRNLFPPLLIGVDFKRDTQR